MKNYEVKYYLILCLFVVFSYIIGWTTKVEALLVIAVQLLCAILILLARIYNAIKKQRHER